MKNAANSIGGIAFSVAIGHCPDTGEDIEIERRGPDTDIGEEIDGLGKPTFS